MPTAASMRWEIIPASGGWEFVWDRYGKATYARCDVVAWRVDADQANPPPMALPIIPVPDGVSAITKGLYAIARRETYYFPDGTVCADWAQAQKHFKAIVPKGKPK